MTPDKPVRAEDIDALISAAHPPAISIYLPTIRAGREVRQNAIRFGNLVRDAAAALDAQGVSPEARATALEPLEKLVDDNDFWQHQQHGLAIFRDARSTHVFPLPETVPEAVTVGERFAVRPLLPLVHFDGRYHVLAFGRDDVRLFAGDRHGLRAVELPDDTPTGLIDVVGAQRIGPHVQHHSGNGPGQTAVFHGQGAGADKEDGELRKYTAWVARTLRPALEPNAPVVLAGTERSIGRFRAVADWPTLCEAWIGGAPGDADVDALHAEAWTIVEPVLRARVMTHLGRFDGLESAERATHDLSTALKAARSGRVEALYFSEDAPVDAGFEELAQETWSNGGLIFEVEAPALPGQRAFEAVFRY